MWYKLLCPFEGASGEGEQFLLYLQWDEEFDEHEVWNHILENKNKISAFVEHSIDVETLQELPQKDNTEIMLHVGDTFTPDYALFQDGRVYAKNVDHDCTWITE